MNYDPMGNISSRTDVAGGASWTYDPVHLHEVTQAGGNAYQYVHDANGNVTSRQGSSISWSSYNYPTLIHDTATGESVSFTYGPDRRAWLEQTQGSSGTETTYHVGGLLDIVSSPCVAGVCVNDYRHYIYAGAEPVAIDSRRSNGTNAFYYLLSDHQGSIAAITNGSGAVVVGESFSAYGSRRNPTTWSGAPSSSDLTTIAGITRQGYTFQDTLGQMGLNDMVGRVQDAITGRFLSADPNVPDPTDPQSYNPYSYTRNNPLTYTDPSGFEDKTPCTGSMIEPCGAGGNNVVVMEGGGGGGGGGGGHSGVGGSSAGGSNLPEGWQDFSMSWQTCIGDQCQDFTQDFAGDLQQNDPGQQAGPSGSACENGNSPCLSEVVVNGYHVLAVSPTAEFQSPTSQGSFGCGSFHCFYQMGEYVGTGYYAGQRGVYFDLNVSGKNANGTWVQTYIDTQTANFTSDFGNTCPSAYYSTAWSNGQWFFDYPSRASWSEPMTWLAQASYLLPNQAGAAFTVQWGFTLSNGFATPIPPLVVAQPWAAQQGNINRAQGAP